MTTRHTDSRVKVALKKNVKYAGEVSGWLWMTKKYEESAVRVLPQGAVVAPEDLAIGWCGDWRRSC